MRLGLGLGLPFIRPTRPAPAEVEEIVEAEAPAALEEVVEDEILAEAED